MATVKRRSTVPYYAAAGTWVIYALLFPLYRVPHFLFVAVVSGVVFFIMNAVCGTVEVTVPDPPKKEETTGNPELDKMIRDGNLAISEMKRLNDSIKDAKISADIDRLEDLSAKIFAQVKADPKKLPQIRKFMDYYLPTTLKLLNAYDRMGAQGVNGENIDNTMQRVESMMSTIVAAFEKQLDMLFGSEAMDISTDITVLENMMKREGLSEDDGELHAESGTATPRRTTSSLSYKGVSDAKESDGVQRQGERMDHEAPQGRVARPDLLCNLCHHVCGKPRGRTAPAQKQLILFHGDLGDGHAAVPAPHSAHQKIRKGTGGKPEYGGKMI